MGENNVIISIGIDEVKRADDTLTDEQALEVLSRFKHHHEYVLEIIDGTLADLAESVKTADIID